MVLSDMMHQILYVEDNERNRIVSLEKNEMNEMKLKNLINLFQKNLISRIHYLMMDDYIIIIIIFKIDKCN